MTGDVDDVTGLLLSWRQGDAAALERVVPLVYQELRRVAARHLRREAPGHALQATALVHEVYLRLVDVDRMTLKDRAHFFGIAAVLMRLGPRRRVAVSPELGSSDRPPDRLAFIFNFFDDLRRMTQVR